MPISKNTRRNIQNFNEHFIYRFIKILFTNVWRTSTHNNLFQYIYVKRIKVWNFTRGNKNKNVFFFKLVHSTKFCENSISIQLKTKVRRVKISSNNRRKKTRETSYPSQNAITQPLRKRHTHKTHTSYHTHTHTHTLHTHTHYATHVCTANGISGANDGGLKRRQTRVAVLNFGQNGPWRLPRNKIRENVTRCTFE